MTYKEVLQAAQGQMGPCRACPVCNGRACGGTIPGPGAKGSGTVAVRNFDAWRNVRLNMDTIHENFEPDTSLTLFGRSFKYPFFAGPVGAMTLHYGDKYNDLDYNNILVPACAAAGIAAFTGDGTNHKVMEGAAAAITACGGAGIPTVKPWDNATVARKIALARSSGCFAMAMDIDADDRGRRRRSRCQRSCRAPFCRAFWAAAFFMLHESNWKFWAICANPPGSS